MSETKTKKELIQFITELVAIKTVNPPGNEAACESVIRQRFEEIGLTVVRKEYEKGRANFIGSIGTGEPSIALVGHLDTVPPGDGWDTNPFFVIQKDGKLYGRGVEDNKGPLAVCWLAVKQYLQKHKKFEGTIYLVAAADEETGSKFGIQALLKDKFKPVYALVPDAGKLNYAVIGEKGIYRVEVAAAGKQAHSSRPDLGVNAILPLAYFALEAEKLSLNKLCNEYFKPLTVNIAVINGGEVYNMVPASASLKIDVRYPPPLTQENIEKEFDKILEKTKVKYPGIVLKIQTDHCSKPHLIDTESNRLIDSFAAAAQDLSIPMKYKTTGGNTIAKFLHEAGCQAFCHNPSADSVAHIANEYIEIDNLLKSAQLYELMLEKFFTSASS